MEKIFINIKLIILIFSFLLPILLIAQIIEPYDLKNLENQGLADITAYKNIKIIDAWDFLGQKLLSLKPVVVGIFDTGVDLTHPEFNGVKTAAYSVIDTAGYKGHGTQIAGIIGANNLSFDNQYLPPQMNGLLSGVRGLDYTLQIRPSSSLASFATSTDGFRYFAILDQLARSPSGIHVINGSFGAPLCSKLTSAQRVFRFLLGLSCYSEIEKFNYDKSIYEDLINQYSNLIFVFGAGNEQIDSQFNLPGGGLNASNVMTVAATNLNDARAIFDPLTSFNSSNFGSSISISAPGIKVYAPKPNFTYDVNFFGTSASAPFVTGTAAILKALEPEYQKYTPGLQMTPGKIKEILIKSADAINTGEPDKRLGSGCFNETAATTGCRLNAYRAVSWYFPPTPSILSFSDLTPTSAKISWTKNNDPDFASYELHRIISLQPLVTQLVVSSTDPNFTSCAVTGLNPNTFYQYGLRTWDKAGLFAKSSNLVVFTTPVPPPSYFLVPYANITIDGDVSDWQGIPPAIIDQVGDKIGDNPGTDIEKVYLAHDGTYFYARIDLADGPPNTGWFFYALHLCSDILGCQIGDCYLLSHYTGIEWPTYLNEFISLDPVQTATVYQDIAAIGPYFLEMRMPLTQLKKDPFIFYASAQTDPSGPYFDRTPRIEIRL